MIGQHDFEPWSMKCRYCGNTKAALDSAARDASTQFCPLAPQVPDNTRRTRVYVSGPLTTGMLTANVRRAADAANELLDAGYAVYLPHTNVLWEMIAPPIDDFEKGYEKWLGHDFEWVGACDVTLRLPGPSHGADREVELAKRLGQSVYLSVADVKLWESPTRPR